MKITHFDGVNHLYPNSISVSTFELAGKAEAQVTLNITRGHACVFIDDAAKVREIANNLLEVAEQMEVINKPVKVEK